MPTLLPEVNGPQGCPHDVKEQLIHQNAYIFPCSPVWLRCSCDHCRCFTVGGVQGSAWALWLICYAALPAACCEALCVILNITSRFSAFYASETILWWTGLGFSVICCTVYVLHEPWLTTKLSHLALLWRHVHLGQTTVNQENSNIFNQMIMMMYIFSSPIIGFTVVDNW